MLAFYVVAAERQGVAPDQLGGTIQTDILKEYIAQKEWCFPVDPGMRLVGDVIEWCAHNMPRWHPVSISGYHIREAGSTAVQELAFTLKNGLTYVEEAVARGLDVDEFAPRLSFFFNAHIDFFEEIAKYRAARRIWAHELRDTFGARDPRSMLMRFHTQTAGVSLTAQQPLTERRSHHHRGAGGRAGRHPVAAHQLLRRGAGAADRGGRPAGAAHPADHRLRDRRGQHRRSARRRVLHRGADRPAWSRVRAPTSTRSIVRAGWWRRSRTTFPSARSPKQPTCCRPRSRRASERSWASTASSSSTRSRRSCIAPIRGWSKSRSSSCGPIGRRATRPRSPVRSSWCARLRPTPREPDAEPDHRRPRGCLRGRVGGRAADRLWQLHGDSRFLVNSRHDLRRHISQLAGRSPRVLDGAGGGDRVDRATAGRAGREPGPHLPVVPGRPAEHLPQRARPACRGWPGRAGGVDLRQPHDRHQAQATPIASCVTETAVLAGALRRLGVEQGRPRDHLHADGAGGRCRDAGVCAHRRGALGRVRRVRRAGAGGPHRRLRSPS